VTQTIKPVTIIKRSRFALLANNFTVKVCAIHKQFTKYIPVFIRE